MVARSLWKAIISFREIEIPVKLYPAVQEKRIAFNLLHANDNVRLRQQMICSHDDQPVPREHQVRGYSVSPGQYVIVTDDMLRQVEPEIDRTIKVQEFVPDQEIDPRYYLRHFHLGPNASDKTYNTLVAALSETDLVGICRWAMRRRAYVGVLYAGRNGLQLSTLRSGNEVYGREDLWLRPVAVTERELRIGTELIENLSAEFRPEQFQDEHQAKLRAMIEQKAAGRQVRIVPFRPKRPTAEQDLVKVLEESLRRVRAR